MAKLDVGHSADRVEFAAKVEFSLRRRYELGKGRPVASETQEDVLSFSLRDHAGFRAFLRVPSLIGAGCGTLLRFLPWIAIGENK